LPLQILCGFAEAFDAQAVTATKRKAQSRVVEMIVPKKPAGAMATA